MGKADFPRDVYQKAKVALATPSLSVKLSYFCDRFDPYQTYSGIIVYHHDSSYEWRAFHRPNAPRGYRGRAFYVLIKRTDGSADQHASLYKKMFPDCDASHGRTCFGGFTITEGAALHVASLNTLANVDGDALGMRLDRDYTWASDGSLGLSEPEELLVDFAIECWKRDGPNSVVQISYEIDRQIEEFAYMYAEKDDPYSDDPYKDEPCKEDAYRREDFEKGGAYEQYVGAGGESDGNQQWYVPPAKAPGNSDWNAPPNKNSSEEAPERWFPRFAGGPRDGYPNYDPEQGFGSAPTGKSWAGSSSTGKSWAGSAPTGKSLKSRIARPWSRKAKS